MTPDAAMKKKGRGTIELWTSDYDNVELRATKCFNNHGVSLQLTYESVNPVVHISRFDRKAKRHVNVSCPSIVTTYGKFRGSVDLIDSLLSLYRIQIRSKNGIKNFSSIFLMLLLYVMLLLAYVLRKYHWQ